MTNTVTRPRFARAPRGRVEHLVDNGCVATRCGLDARPMAKFLGSERGQDSFARPTCSDCREVNAR
jgi:hypothetical protein